METAKFREQERNVKSFGFAPKKEGRKRPRDEAFNDNGKQPIVEEVLDYDMGVDDHDKMEGVRSSLKEGSTKLSKKSVGHASVSASKVTWPWIYKQRRLLERNWDKGKYTTFRLPQTKFEHEGHTECVYTIQHIGDTLVSGSRDKSIRIWDLSTYRLKAKPLYGHDASVLCLQFDDRPEEDIIISGGSDNYVIVWKFSTGEIVKKMTDAHTESVLNLRFDERYLVTCSKDKTIKIWNRRDISNTDSIIPMRVVNNFAEMDIIPALTLLDSFGGSRDGHNAAVNAVQIHGDTIVSASGDRSVKAWNIHTGYPKKSYEGHAKGIACVQFDGRRVVSGSSDNTVRIFDYDTTGEIACLDGHSDLVRTVQARFGDLRITSDEELHSQSREVDRNFRRAFAAGQVEQRTISRRGPGRNAGSSDPNQVLSIGNKIPPGGGGSKWARIVSGSYDETVIVWKRDREGNWKPNQRLHQGVLPNTRAANNPRNAPVAQAAALTQAAALAQPPANTIAQPPANTAAPAQPPAADGAAQLAQMTPAQIRQSIATERQARRRELRRVAELQHVEQQTQRENLMRAMAVVDFGRETQAGPSSDPYDYGPGPQYPPVRDRLDLPSMSTNVPVVASPAAITPGAGSNTTPRPAATQAATDPAAQGAPNPNLAAGAAVAAHHHHHHGHHHHHHHHHPNAAAAAAAAARAESNRVFKIQFDARRIIACSQNRVVVGWDFAAGDKDLEMIGDWSSETP
jgi:F-box and WD-40 domain protein 1/11